jgi:catechol 2,3-dioxygenase-like lactoylglutathione lyase family enzyme
MRGSGAGWPRRYFEVCRRRSCGDRSQGSTTSGGYGEDVLPLVTALDHVQVAAPPGGDDDARHFYGELLGLPELSKPDALRARGGVWFAVGAQQLHIGIEAGFAPARKAHPALRVSDLDTLAARLAAAGVAVAWDDAIPGVRRFHVSDPFGNRIELLG